MILQGTWMKSCKNTTSYVRLLRSIRCLFLTLQITMLSSPRADHSMLARTISIHTWLGLSQRFEELLRRISPTLDFAWVVSCWHMLWVLLSNDIPGLRSVSMKYNLQRRGKRILSSTAFLATSKLFTGTKIHLTSPKTLSSWLQTRKRKIKPFVMDAELMVHNTISKWIPVCLMSGCIILNSDRKLSIHWEKRQQTSL